MPDTETPALSYIKLRNPGLNNATSDPTVVGRVADNGSINNVAYVELDPNRTAAALHLTC